MCHRRFATVLQMLVEDAMLMIGRACSAAVLTVARDEKPKDLIRIFQKAAFRSRVNHGAFAGTM